MPVVVPSQIVQFIDRTLGYFKTSPPQGIQLHPSICGALNGLLRLIEQLPNSLLPDDPGTYAEFIQSQESIRFAVKRAEVQSVLSDMQSGPPYLVPDGGGKPSQVQIIRAALAACPDEVPPRHSQDLPFITPPDFRKALLIDLQTTRSALSNGEWKAATVLAGSIIEALLLWAVQQKPSVDVWAAATKVAPKPASDILRWDLHELAVVAEQLNLIEPDTGKQTQLARNFRNLIHPGRVLRTQQSCDRGTALVASAAVELVSRDLQAQFP